jgi:hypothetical protein
VRERTSATPTAAATSASRIAVAPAEIGTSAAADLDDRDERGGQEKQQGEVRAAADDEQCDKNDQACAPQIEQDPAPAVCEPFAPRHDHCHGVGRRRGQRQTDEQPAMPRAHVEGEAGEHDGNRGPPEPVADLHGG